MTWVAWRQTRFELALLFLVLIALTAFLIPTGLDKQADFESSDLKTCVDTGIVDCWEVRQNFLNGYNTLNAVVSWFNFIPAVVGLLLAVPVVIEFDRRTYRLAWSQSVGRRRWLATKVAAALLGMAMFSAVLTLLMTWWFQPFNRAEPLDQLQQSFNFAGFMPFASAFWSFGLAMAAGVFSRKIIVTVPAALVGFIGLRIPLDVILRPGYEGPADGPAVEQAVTDAVGRFWPLQMTEAGILVGLSVILIILTAWVVERRIR
jgi:ABC-type transport system involved in multi-copper enzyme maturation permease subunit